MYKAILVGKKIKLVDDSSEWGHWFETADRHVANDKSGEIQVSTVFLGLNHGFEGPPLWFETMIFGGEHDGYMERYTTWEEAEAGHLKALALAFPKDKCH